MEEDVVIITCEECDGDGRIECDQCQGFKRWTECMHGGNCPCDGYEVECEECDRLGEKVCVTCQGFGEHPLE